MGSDLVTALGQATVKQQTIFGANIHRPVGECQTVQLRRGHHFAVGEKIQTTHVVLPQVRQTATVLAGQAHGQWGYTHGVNEHRLAVGCARWHSLVPRSGNGLTGPDLVRLVLERSHSTHQAVDVVAQLLAHPGQGSADGREDDPILLIADPSEAIVVEMAGPYWAAQEIHRARAVSDVAVIRQDWDRLSPGLFDFAIQKQWWQEDGSKLDVAGSLNAAPKGQASALRRWGHATRLLEEQSGSIDHGFIRRGLADHFDGASHESGPIRSMCEHDHGVEKEATAASFVVELPKETNVAVKGWCAFGPPCLCPYFPVFMEAELPEQLTCGGSVSNSQSLWWRTQQLLNALGGDPERWASTRDQIASLQTRFEQEADEAQEELPRLSQPERQRHCSSLLQSHLERFEELVQNVLAQTSKRTVPAAR